MTEEARALLEQALELPARDRAFLARSLIASLSEDACAEEVDKAWAEEAQRRLARIESGEVQAVAWEDVRARLRAKFGV
ncbi:MAG TPA: addiction module protein [Planctomycetes bacterium]|nr:addiction module protein [Planctomycetota bacterium]